MSAPQPGAGAAHKAEAPTAGGVGGGPNPRPAASGIAGLTTGAPAAGATGGGLNAGPAGARMGMTTGAPDPAALERERPELAPWLRPLRVALAALETGPWRALRPRLDPGRAADAPLLEGAELALDARATAAMVDAVLREALGRAAGGVARGGEGPGALDVLAAAVALDEPRLHELADAAGVDADALAAAAQLATIPLLQGCRAALEPLAPGAWAHGYCPLCGAQPAFAEVRGLERTRVLRCGRCGSAWKTEVLLCPFCGERDHQRLGSLVPEGAAGQVRWLEFCRTCDGYVKAFATLRGAAPEAVPVQDAASVELDLAAAERGFTRPPTGVFPAHPRFVAAAGERA